MEWLKYETSTRTLQARGNIVLDAWSNGFTVKNAGNSILSFNGDPIQPNESKGFGGNRGELIEGNYSFFFTAPASPPPGYVQSDLAIITEKYYKPTEAQRKMRVY
jgi:hypothetical protein